MFNREESAKIRQEFWTSFGKSFPRKWLLYNTKIIHRIYVIHKSKFSIHNKDTWRECYEFFIENMTQFELFFHEYEDVVKNAL